MGDFLSSCTVRIEEKILFRAFSVKISEDCVETASEEDDNRANASKYIDSDN